MVWDIRLGKSPFPLKLSQAAVLFNLLCVAKQKIPTQEPNPPFCAGIPKMGIFYF